MRQKAKANEEAKKMLKRKDDKATLDKDITNSNLERESDGNQSGNLESESEGGKSGKRKRKLFNSFCDDLMDENGEVHPQVKRSRKSLEVMADVAVFDKSREFNPNLNQSIEYEDVHDKASK